MLLGDLGDNGVLHERRVIGAERRVGGDNDALFPAEVDELFLSAGSRP